MHHADFMHNDPQLVESIVTLRSIMRDTDRQRPRYKDHDYRGAIREAIHRGVRMSREAMDVVPDMRIELAADGTWVGRVAYALTASGLSYLAARAGIRVTAQDIREVRGDMQATVVVDAPQADGTMRPFTATASFHDWYSRDLTAAMPASGIAPVRPGQFVERAGEVMIAIARAMAHKAALGERIAGSETLVDITMTRQHGLTLAVIAQRAARIDQLRFLLLGPAVPRNPCTITMPAPGGAPCPT